MDKKKFATIGMICSTLFVVMGILVFTGLLGGDASYPSGASYGYDSGYATFGADFYNFVSNNAAEAASASRTAANNVKELCLLIKNVCGVALMGFGLFGVCHFGILRCSFIEEENASKEPESVESVEEAETAESVEETEPVEVTESVNESEMSAEISE